MNMPQGEIRRWSPVDRSTSVSRPERAARTPVSRRSAEDQAAHRAQVESMRVQSEPKAERVDWNAEAQVADAWEVRRQELVAGGRVFDEEGNITEDGEALLRASGWTNEQMITMEQMQKNHTAEVQVTRESVPVRETAAMSARERPRILVNARVAAEQALQERGQAEAEKRRQQGERAMVGMRARANAIYSGKSEADADRLQEEAQRAYDLQQQRAQNIRASS